MAHTTASYSEALLQDIWRELHLFLVPEPILIDGTAIVILDPGVHNTDKEGPDFHNAQILIDNILIKGDIEIHRYPKDWQTHNHSSDKHYSRVILHIILDDDSSDARPSIPTLVLRDNFDFSHSEYWRRLFEKHYARKPELPCFPHNLALNMKIKRRLIRAMSELRIAELTERYAHTTRDQLLDIVYERILDALGFSQNRKPMRALAKLLPRTLLQQIRNNEPPLLLGLYFEALFLHTAGLLPDASKEFDDETNEYILELNSISHLLSISYQLPDPLDKLEWSFYKLRQVNSPYRRVAAAAGLAELYFSRDNLSLSDSFTIDHKDSFWTTRSSYTKSLGQRYSLIGNERHRSIEVNVLLPAQIASVEFDKQKETLAKQWYQLRSSSSASLHRIISQELLESESITSVGEEQGSLLLYRQYCSKLRCSECPLGKELIERKMMMP